MSGFSVNPTAFRATRDGQVFYSFSGKYSGGDVSNNAINIANSGLDDLLVKATVAFDWLLIAADAGASISIDGSDIIVHRANVTGLPSVGFAAPFVFDFIVPAQSALVIKTLVDAASAAAGAGRYVFCTAQPFPV